MGTESPKGSKRREVLEGLGVAALLILLMMWLSGTFVKKVQPGEIAPPPKPEHLQTSRTEKRTFPVVMEQAGTVRGRDVARVSSRIMAQVKQILVREGDRVQGSETGRPTLLATLDDRDLQDRVRQAESQLAAAERGVGIARAKLASAIAQSDSARANSEKATADFRRFQVLAEQNAATRQQLDHMRTQRDSATAQLRSASQEAAAARGEIARIEAMRDAARAALAQARSVLAYSRIFAPFSGTLIKKMVDEGTMASPGQPLFLVETSQQPELRVNLSESLLTCLKVGQELEVGVDAPNRSVTGILREIVPQSDPRTRTVLVKVSLPFDPRLVNGLFGRLRVPCGQYTALTIPAKAVRETGQLHLVNVIDKEGYPRRRFVTLGRTHDSVVEVLSGLQENEEVVIP